jgi:flagellar biosynthesis protein FliR
MLGCATTKEMDMKLYAAMFLATLCMPLASLAGIFAMEFGYVWNIRQAIGIGALAGSVILIVAIITFLSSMPMTLRCLRNQTRASNDSH